MSTGALLAFALTASAHDDAASAGQDAHDGTTVTPLMSTALDGLPGKEGMMLTVEYAPGASTEAHRHDAHTFVYVLEGSIVMQVKGGEEVTLIPGQTFYETPSDIHSVSRNASATDTAKFLVFFVKEQGAAPVLPPT
jgi:quercetin dioxygenase-like cupin family protein